MRRATVVLPAPGGPPIQRTCGSRNPARLQVDDRAKSVAVLDRREAEAWIAAHVEATGPLELAHERSWSTVVRVPVEGGSVWFKACAPVQAFESRLAAELAARWPDRLPHVLAHDEQRAWLLLADGGRPLAADGNPPEAWLDVLPLYAELQRGEAAHAAEHLEHGVPDLRVAGLPAAYEELLAHDLPLEPDERRRLVAFGPRFAELCAELAEDGLPASVQHDDLHIGNVYFDRGRPKILDWGDASIAHPFFSLVVTFRFLEESTRMRPGDTWFARLRDAYLEPWGADLRDRFDLALRVGAVAHLFSWARQRSFLADADREGFDRGFAIVLRRALAAVPRRRAGSAPVSGDGSSG